MTFSPWVYSILAKVKEYKFYCTIKSLIQAKNLICVKVKEKKQKFKYSLSICPLFLRTEKKLLQYFDSLRALEIKEMHLWKMNTKKIQKFANQFLAASWTKIKM